MTFAEDLPPHCPPNDAEDTAYASVFRLVFKGLHPEDYFKSHEALGRPNRTNANPCRFASCSLVFDPIAQIARFPRLREECSHAIQLSVPAGAGLSKSKKHSNHVDFWCFSHYNMADGFIDHFAFPEDGLDG